MHLSTFCKLCMTRWPKKEERSPIGSKPIFPPFQRRYFPPSCNTPKFTPHGPFFAYFCHFVNSSNTVNLYFPVIFCLFTFTFSLFSPYQSSPFPPPRGGGGICQYIHACIKMCLRFRGRHHKRYSVIA
jgi:hypothetical protein